MMKRERDKDEEAKTTMITEVGQSSLCCPTGSEETDELTASLLFSPPSIVTSITPPTTIPIPIHNNRVIHSEHHREDQQQHLDETEEHLLLDQAEDDENDDQHSKSHLVAITGDSLRKNSYNSGSSSGSISSNSGGSGSGGSTTIREQDLYLPVANISRVMKSCLPENAKIAKDAKEVMQEYLTEFILFLASEASDLCMYDKRKTMNGDDLLEAMEKLGFEEYVPLLTEYLASYRENQKKLEKQKASTVSSATATKK